jgi:hypothetical protein
MIMPFWLFGPAPGFVRNYNVQVGSRCSPYHESLGICSFLFLSSSFLALSDFSRSFRVPFFFLPHLGTRRFHAQLGANPLLWFDCAAMHRPFVRQIDAAELLTGWWWWW